MKKNVMLLCLIGCMAVGSLQAQRVVWQDDFETSKGWSEYEDEAGSAAVKNGVLQIKSKEGWIFRSKCKTNLDGNKNFTISVDVALKNGLKQDRYVGLLFDYDDNKNYKAFFVEKGFVYFEQYKEGVLIRQEKEPLKNRSKNDSKQLTFELQRKGQSALFLVNDEETIDMDGVEVHSNRVAVMVSGDQEVSFDNIKITQ